MLTLLEPAPSLTLSCLLHWLIDSDAPAAGVTTDPKKAAVTRGVIEQDEHDNYEGGDI